MFTGIVTDVGEVLRGRASAPKGCAGCGSPAPMTARSIAIGASIACSGVCLTVVETGEERRSHLVCGRCGGRDAAR